MEIVRILQSYKNVILPVLITVSLIFLNIICHQIKDDVSSKFWIGGTVSGLPGKKSEGEELIMQLNAEHDIHIFEDNYFYFPDQVNNKFVYDVTVISHPKNPDQECFVTDGSGKINGKSFTDIFIECILESYSIGGTVSGLSGTGLVLQINGGDDLEIFEDGDFTFETPIQWGTEYTVDILTQPSDPDQICVIQNETGIVAGSDITDISIICGFTVGGNFSGVSIPVTFQNNGSDDLTLTEDGNFTFFVPVLDGAIYNISILTEPFGLNCSVENGSGTVVGENINNILITCVSRWTSLGFLSDGLVWSTSIAVSTSDNKPVVVFSDYVNMSKAHILKWDTGTTWNDLGFASSEIASLTSIAIDPSDSKPIVAFQDPSYSRRVHVLKWDTGTTWDDLGFVSFDEAWFISLAIDPSDNKPIIHFRDSASLPQGKPHILKWDTGITWNDLGYVIANPTTYTSIAIGQADNKPVVIFMDLVNDDRARVYKWQSGTTWNNLGYVSDGEASYTSIAIDPSDNKPIIVYQDVENGKKAHVFKWVSGTTWEDLGFASTGTAESIIIIIDPSDNKPIIAFIDKAKNNRFHVIKRDTETNWTDYGFVSPGSASYPSITMDPSDNKPIAAFRDIENNNRAHVKKFE